MSDPIRVLIVDDLPETRENVRKLLQFETDIEVIGQAGTGEEAIEMAKQHQPDIILMDINMPGIDGISASQRITELVPRAQIIIMSVQSDSDYLRRAMLAGARDFLTKPFGGDELIQAVRRVYSKRPVIPVAPIQTHSSGSGTGSSPDTITRQGSIIAVFSPKGGSGCSTVAINTSVMLAKRNYKTVLIDGSLQFGDVDVMLNLKPVTSIVDLVERGSDLDSEFIESVVQLHSSGLSVLLAPPRPEMAEVVTDEKLSNLLETLRSIYDFIIVDTSSHLNEIALASLDKADRIILIAMQSLPSLKNISRFYDLTESLDYAADKFWLIVNKASNKKGISVKDISNALKRAVTIVIPHDDATDTAANQGVPIVMNASRQPVSNALAGLADHIIQELADEASEEKEADSARDSGLLGRLFGGRSRSGG